MSTRAVLTGDLVRSTELSPESLDRARDTLLAAIMDIASWQKNLLGAQPDFFRGDSWQVLLTKPCFYLRSAIFLRARLRARDPEWDTRIAIGLGRVARVDKHKTSMSTGEAFILSGQLLDVMGSSNITVATPARVMGWAALSPLTQISSALVDDWSQKQAEIASLALTPAPPTQAQMAERLGVTQQSVSKTLAAAKVPLLLQAIGYCEHLNWRRLEMI